MELQTTADPAVLRLRAHQLCYLGRHAPQSGKIIGILKLKDDMPIDLANSVKADEEDRKNDHATLVAATLTAMLETHFRQGDLGVQADGIKGDLTETENSFAGDEASSEREERQKSRAYELRSRLLLRR